MAHWLNCNCTACRLSVQDDVFNASQGQPKRWLDKNSSANATSGAIQNSFDFEADARKRAADPTQELDDNWDVRISNNFSWR